MSKEYKNRQKKVKGGLIEGKEEVPFTKENPADRINKFTGEPYQAQMERLGFNDGGMKEVALDIVGEQILADYNITDDEEGKRKFVNLVYEVARQENHPNPIFAVTQAVLETGWGTKEGGNLYGIKARKGEKAKTVRTRELEGEELALTDEKFIDLSNESVRKNVQHYNNLMAREYPQVLTELSQGNIEEAAKHLQSKEKGGYRDNTNYATDPDYINKVVELYPFVERRIQGLDKTP